MLTFLLSLSTGTGIATSMVLALVSGMVVYLFSYRLISRYQDGDLNDPTTNLFAVVGMLVSLMLSLAFAEVVSEKRTIEKALEQEAAAISDLFSGLQRFDPVATHGIRVDLVEYAQAIIDDDWSALANDRLGEHAGMIRKRISKSIITLEPSTALQQQLWNRLLDDLDAVSNYRVIRLDNALAAPPVYIYIIVFGFLVTMACFGVYRPQPPLLALASLYTVFVGLVAYLILALSDPFQGWFGVAPTTIEHLVQALRSEML